MKVVLFLSLSFLISGCSNKNLYESVQTDKSDCRKLPVQQREDCFKRVDKLMTFDEYNKERGKVVH
jgi:hypothetical protein